MTTANRDGLAPTLSRKALAAGVHLVTASGAIWSVLAIDAIVDARWQAAFFWMGLSLIIDMLDGSLARLARVDEVFPSFDGALLDNLVDFLSYVLVPAVFIYRVDLLPPGLALIGVVIVCLSSAYQFSQGNAKTPDHYFTGFPSYWNVAVFYLFFLDWSPWLNLGVLALLGIAAFVPIQYIYPSRTRRHRGVMLVATAVWGLLVALAVLQYPDSRTPVLMSMTYLPFYVGLSLYHQISDRSEPTT